MPLLRRAVAGAGPAVPVEGPSLPHAEQQILSVARAHRCPTPEPTGRPVGEAAVLLRFAEIWEEGGPTDHPYEGFYRRNAEDMVVRAVSHTVLSSGASARPEWEIELGHGRVRLRPDHFGEPEDEAGSQPVVRRLRTGRSSKSERDKPMYGLYQKAADLDYPRHKPRLERVYLSTGEVEDARMKPRQTSGPSGERIWSRYSSNSVVGAPAPLQSPTTLLWGWIHSSSRSGRCSIRAMRAAWVPPASLDSAKMFSEP